MSDPALKSKAKQRWEKFFWFVFCFSVLICLAAILFPVFAQSKRGPHYPGSSSSNIRQITLAAIMYGADHDDRMPPLLSGPWRSLQDVRDGELTSYGERRTEGWPLLLIDYTKSRLMHLQPEFARADRYFQGPALAKGDEGYDASANTYRNQSLFPHYGLNYQFLAPLLGNRNAASPLLDARPQTRRFESTEDPGGTIFFTESSLLTKQFKRGFFAVNAPGMWDFLANHSPYVTFGNGIACTGGWCRDVDPETPGEQESRGFVYGRSVYGPKGNAKGIQVYGANYSFIDGHVRYAHEDKVTAGTTFVMPHDEISYEAERIRGDCVIIDKSKYLWNLNDEFIDEAMDVARAARP